MGLPCPSHCSCSFSPSRGYCGWGSIFAVGLSGKGGEEQQGERLEPQIPPLEPQIHRQNPKSYTWYSKSCPRILIPTAGTPNPALGTPNPTPGPVLVCRAVG